MNKRRGPITAEELMTELLNDAGYRTFLDDAEQQKEFNRENYKREAADLLAELAELGYDIQYVGDLRQRRIRYENAIPVLVKWMPRIKDPAVKEDVVRTLSVPWARPTALKALIDEFRGTPDHHEIGLRWAIGNALEVVADDSAFDDIVELATSKKYGKSREMVVASLGNMKDPKAIEVLIGLLKDDQVAPYAVMALGKLNAKEARPKIEAFLNHPESWVRSEAKKALKRLG